MSPGITPDRMRGCVSHELITSMQADQRSAPLARRRGVAHHREHARPVLAAFLPGLLSGRVIGRPGPLVLASVSATVMSYDAENPRRP